MKIKGSILLIIIVVFISFSSLANKPQITNQHSVEKKMMSHKVLFKQLIGQWQGTVKTWFQPGKLADDSRVNGEFTDAMNGHFIRHTYLGSMQVKARNGEEILTFNTVTKQYEMSWFDSFHMNYGLLFSKGEALSDGFAVTGQYDFELGQPSWSWRTEYHLIDNNHLTIVVYNIMPDGVEGKAVEIIYARVK